MATAINEAKTGAGKRRKRMPAVTPRVISVVNEVEQVNIPAWVVDLASFRRWADTDDFPEKGNIWYLKGLVWIDMSKEQLFSHLRVKSEISTKLDTLVKDEQLGLFFPDGLFLTNISADIGGGPDATFVSFAALRAGRVRLVEGRQGGYVEVEGSPDMVLDVVSQSSVHKDTVALREAYWEAGIREYWLVDARREPLKFDILRHTGKGYVATRKQSGWLKSAVYNKSFRLTQATNAAGYPEFTLAMQ
jgi:Uma2 family endonuclease